MKTSFPGSSVGKKSTCNAGDPSSIPGSGRSTGEEISYPLQYSCLGNPMDRGAWQARIHGITKSQIQLSNYTAMTTISTILQYFYNLHEWNKKWQLSPVFLPGKFHGQRSLAGYSPWGHKELDMTEHTHINFMEVNLPIYTYIFFSMFFSIMVYQRTLNIVSCAVQ